MSAPTKGHCAVCGTETAQRCSSCWKADIAVFMCSTEHQSLVWPVHKLVCGPGKANPFTPPDLTDSEITVLSETLDRRCRHAPTQDPGQIELFGTADPTVAAIFERGLALEKGQLKQLLPTLRQFLGNRVDKADVTRIIRNVLCLAAIVAHHAGQPFPTLSPFPFAAYVASKQVSQFTAGSSLSNATSLHRGLILAATANAIRARSPAAASIGIDSLSLVTEAWIRDMLPNVPASETDSFVKASLKLLFPIEHAFPDWMFYLRFNYVLSTLVLIDVHLCKMQKRL